MSCDDGGAGSEKNIVTLKRRAVKLTRQLSIQTKRVIVYSIKNIASLNGVNFADEVEQMMPHARYVDKTLCLTIPLSELIWRASTQTRTQHSISVQLLCLPVT